MFKNRESVSQVVGSAAIGVAVGMLVHKILSPRSSQQSSSITASPMRYEYVQQQPQANNLQVPSHYNKHRKHRHHSSSNSASRAEQVEKEIGYFSDSSPLVKKSKLRASKTGLGSNPQTDKDESILCHYEKLEPRKNSENMASTIGDKSVDADSHILNTCTKLAPTNSEDSNNSSRTIEKDHNLEFFGKTSASKSTEGIRFQLKDKKDLCATTEDYKLNSDREFLASNFTEYLLLNLKDHKNLGDATKEYKLNCYRETLPSRSSEHLPLKLEDQKALSSNAKDYELNSYCESFANESTEYLPLKLEHQKDLCKKAEDYKLNHYRESFSSKSTEYIPIKLKNEKDYELNSCHETFAIESPGYPTIKMEQKSKIYEPLSLLFDVKNEKSMIKNDDLISSTSNLDDGIVNYTTMGTCDTVEKDYNFN